ncbi:hypothetical protein CYMTET_26739, partial [Cymbomonas tetramitiformis]
ARLTSQPREEAQSEGSALPGAKAAAELPGQEAAEAPPAGHPEEAGGKEELEAKSRLLGAAAQFLKAKPEAPPSVPSAPAPPPALQELAGVAAEDWLAVVDEWLLRDSRALPPGHRTALAAAIGGCPNGVFVHLAYLLLLDDGGGRYTESDLPKDLPQAAAALIERLEIRLGPRLVGLVLGLITCSAQGMSMAELEDVLACDDELVRRMAEVEDPLGGARRMPPHLLAHLKTQLAGYIIETVPPTVKQHEGAGEAGEGGVDDVVTEGERTIALSTYNPPVRRVPALLLRMVRHSLGSLLQEVVVNGVVLLRWRYQVLRDTAIERYLGSKDGKAAVCEALADYFQGRWVVGKPLRVVTMGGTFARHLHDCQVPNQPLRPEGGLGAAAGPGLRPNEGLLNRRKLAELHSAELGAGRWAEAAALVCDLEYLSAKFQAGLGHDAMQECSTTAVALRVKLLECESSEDGEEVRGALDDVLSVEHFLKTQSGLLEEFPGLFLQTAVNRAALGSALAAAARKVEEVVDGKGVQILRWLNPRRVKRICRRVLHTGGHEGMVRGCAFSPTRPTRVASVGEDHQVLLWNPSSGSAVARLVGHSNKVKCVCFSSDGRWLATGSDDRSIIVWDMTAPPDYKQVTCIRWRAEVMSCHFSEDGQHLTAGALQGYMAVWDTKQWDMLTSWKAHKGGQLGVRCCRWSPHGGRILSAGDDGLVKVWGLRGGGMDDILSAAQDLLEQFERCKEAMKEAWDTEQWKLVGWRLGDKLQELYHADDERLSVLFRTFVLEEEIDMAEAKAAESSPAAILELMGKYWDRALAPESYQARIARVACLLPVPPPCSRSWNKMLVCQPNLVRALLNRIPSLIPSVKTGMNRWELDKYPVSTPESQELASDSHQSRAKALCALRKPRICSHRV